MVEMSSTSAGNPAQAIHPFQTDDANLHAIHDKVVAGIGLDFDDVLSLYRSTDVLGIGWLANFVRRRWMGNAVRITLRRFVVTPQAGTAQCPLCSSSPASGDSLREQIKLSFGDEKPGRVVVLGQLTSETLNAVRELKAAFSSSQVSAFTLPQVAEFCATRQIARDACLAELREAGIEGLVGEGAELLLPQVRHMLGQHRLRAEEERALRESAVKAGLRAPLCLLLQEGDTEQDRARATLVLSSSVMDRTVSLLTLGRDSGLQDPFTTGMQELKQISIARLVAGQGRHIRVCTQALGSKLSQLALRFGASELDASSLPETAESPETRLREAERQVRAAGLQPESAHEGTVLVVSLTS